jgi:hypothetical protein
MPPHASKELADWLRPFATCFTAAIWRHVLVLVAGTLLAPGRRTVTAALRVMALDQTASFAVYHRVLSTARWSPRAVARRLLLLLVATFVQDGPVVIGIDDTIERRWGAKIKVPWHPPRSRALQPRTLRQGFGPALVVPDGDGAGTVGQHLGSAVPHRARSF